MNRRTNQTSGLIRLLLSILAISLLALGAAYLYIGPLRTWDTAACSERMATRLAITPSMSAAYRYINGYLHRSLVGGMSRDDVIEKLKEVGPIRVSTTSIPGGYRDTVWFTYCYLPIDYIRIDIWYDAGKHLLNFDLYND